MGNQVACRHRRQRLFPESLGVAAGQENATSLCLRIWFTSSIFTGKTQAFGSLRKREKLGIFQPAKRILTNRWKHNGCHRNHSADFSHPTAFYSLRTRATEKRRPGMSHSRRDSGDHNAPTQGRKHMDAVHPSKESGSS